MRRILIITAIIVLFVSVGQALALSNVDALTLKKEGQKPLFIPQFQPGRPPNPQPMISQGIVGQVHNNLEIPLAAAIVYVQGTSIEVNTDAQGKYYLALEPGTYQLTVFKMNHTPQTQSAVVNPNQTTTLDFTPTYSPGTIRRVPQDYPTIQAAVDASTAGDTVLVAPGTYYESVVVRFKDINVIGSGASQTTINAGGSRGFFVEHQNNPGFVISGFRIENCSIGIYGEHTSGTFTNLVTECNDVGYIAWFNTPSQGAGPDPQIRNNVFKNSVGGVIIITGNLYVINNVFDNTGVAIWIRDHNFGPSFPIVMNNIFINNGTVLIESNLNNMPSIADTSYNNLWNNSALNDYELDSTDIVADPVFTSDYHLQRGSPSIDAGEPTKPFFDLPGVGERSRRNDQGVYGGLFVQ